MAMTKISTVVFDNITGYFDLAKAEMQPEPTPDGKTTGDWGLQWNALMGRWGQKVRLLLDINKRHGTRVIMIGHLVPSFIGKGEERKQNGWVVDVPGSGAGSVLVPFDEVYRIATLPNATGAAPPRKLFTQPHTFENYPFEAKSRLGVGEKGAIMNPTWQSVMQTLPAGVPEPTCLLLVGSAGAGKTTFASTIASPEEPALFIDMMGGTQRVAIKPGVHVTKPRNLAEVYRTLLALRAKPEWQVAS